MSGRKKRAVVVAATTFQNYRHLKMLIPIPAEYDDTDTNINAGHDSNHNANFRQRWKLNDVLLSRKPLGSGPTRLADYAENKCYLFRVDGNV